LANCGIGRGRVVAVTRVHRVKLTPCEVAVADQICGVPTISLVAVLELRNGFIAAPLRRSAHVMSR
jgi:hypothetical protein